SWPSVIDDSFARNDWGWVNQYDFKDTLDALLRAGN
ncbi:MAG: NAD-dependent epimerase, partial [Rhodobacteraceae bacterium]|nr:NAD-dependent epimerase [Paracoccaceae bacterium]